MQENSIRLAGYLGKKPELQYTPNGTSVVKVKLGETQRYKNKGGQDVEHTDWHTLVFWGDQADFAAKNYDKGDNLTVQGSYRSRKFTPKDGTERTVWEVTVFRAAKLFRASKAKDDAPNLDTPDAKDVIPVSDVEPSELHANEQASAWPIH